MTSMLRQLDLLTASERDAMFALLSSHFDGTTRDVFEADLAGKTHAILLLDHLSWLAGFSTFAVYDDAGPDGEPATIVCSGDTIVAPRARGASDLPRSWVRAVHRLHRATGNPGLYWLLITSGYRTYRFLPVFVQRFQPGIDQAPDPAAVACMTRLAEARWGDQFDPASGVVRLKHPQPLRQEQGGIPPQRMADPHVAFFNERNPGHAAGDELVSFASLEVDNLTPAGRRMLGSPRMRGTSRAEPALDRGRR